MAICCRSSSERRLNPKGTLPPGGPLKTKESSFRSHGQNVMSTLDPLKYGDSRQNEKLLRAEIPRPTSSIKLAAAAVDEAVRNCQVPKFRQAKARILPSPYGQTLNMALIPGAEGREKRLPQLNFVPTFSFRNMTQEHMLRGNKPRELIFDGGGRVLKLISCNPPRSSFMVVVVSLNKHKGRGTKVTFIK